MSLVISDDLLELAHMKAAELAQEIAVLLYERDKLTLGQASQLAQMSQLQFQHLLASRGIAVHYGVADFEADLQTLRERAACDRRQQHVAHQAIRYIVDRTEKWNRRFPSR